MLTAVIELVTVVTNAINGRNVHIRLPIFIQLVLCHVLLDVPRQVHGDVTVTGQWGCLFQTPLYPCHQCQPLNVISLKQPPPPNRPMVTLNRDVTLGTRPIRSLETSKAAINTQRRINGNSCLGMIANDGATPCNFRFWRHFAPKKRRAFPSLKSSGNFP